MSYNNVVIQCGINNITSSKTPINEPSDVRAIFDIFKNKVDQIMSVTEKINVYIVPILPTRSVTYNRAVRVFNSLIKSNIIDFYYRCMCINVSELEFSDDSLFLRFCMLIGTTFIPISKLSEKLRMASGGQFILNITPAEKFIILILQSIKRVIIIEAMLHVGTLEWSKGYQRLEI